MLVVVVVVVSDDWEHWYLLVGLTLRHNHKSPVSCPRPSLAPLQSRWLGLRRAIACSEDLLLMGTMLVCTGTMSYWQASRQNDGLRETLHNGY